MQQKTIGLVYNPYKSDKMGFAGLKSHRMPVERVLSPLCEACPVKKIVIYVLIYKEVAGESCAVCPV